MDQRPPLPYLRWEGDPSLLGDEARILEVLRIARTSPMQHTAASMLTKVVGSNKDAFSGLKNGLYHGKAIEYLLNSLVSSSTGKKKLDDWLRKKEYALNFVTDDIHREMDTVKKIFFLPTKSVDSELIATFDLHERITSVLASSAPTVRKILYSAAQSPRAEKENTVKNPEVLSSIVLAQLCNGRSRMSLLFQQAMGFFLYSSGISKLAIDVLSKCGISTSYTTINEAHIALSNSLMDDASRAARKPHGIGIDNIQIPMSEHVEQRFNAPLKVRSCTTAIMYELRGNVAPEVCDLKAILERKRSCEVISYRKHIRADHQARSEIHEHFVLDIIEILVKQDHLGFNEYLRPDEIHHKQYRPPPLGYKTKEYGLRTVEIDEASTVGCIEFLLNVYLEQLGFKETDLPNLAIPCFNDQLTNSRIRSAHIERRGDVSTLHKMQNFQLGIGLFHLQMNLLNAIHNTHKGSEDTPGSLAFYTKLLGIVRLGREHPDYYTLRSFTMTVLDAHILQCWRLKTETIDLETFAKSKPSLGELKRIASEIVLEYFSESGLRKCTKAEDNIEESDDWLRNTILLNRDLLYFYELDQAISSGDFGRLEILLGTLTRMFRGAGATNYSSELLHLIQNLTFVWPTEFGNVMRDNSLISVMGHDKHYMGVDLNIEHSINFQKRYFAAKGVHGSLKQLEGLAPCTKVYRPLRRRFIAFTGASWGGTTHSNANVSSNVTKVLRKAQETDLFKIRYGRKSTTITTDIIDIGGEILEQTGMKSFAKNFKAWANAETYFVNDAEDINLNSLSIDTDDED